MGGRRKHPLKDALYHPITPITVRDKKSTRVDFLFSSMTVLNVLKRLEAMEQIEETRRVMDELIKQLKTKQAVADRLGQSKQAFNKAYHYAKYIPLERAIEMKLLLNQLRAEKNPGQAIGVPTPQIDEARLKLELLTSDQKGILAHFKAVRSLLMPSYAGALSFDPKLKLMSADIYTYAPLLEAEKSTQLPLRTAFMGLLSCCDANGYFYWEPEHLKAAIFPYLPIHFSRLLDALCQWQLIEKRKLEDKWVGYIPLKNQFVYECEASTRAKRTQKDKSQTSG